MNLHIVNKSAYTHQKLALCLEMAVSGDQLLLIEDGVLSCRHNLVQTGLARGLKIYLLEADLQARGLVNGLASEINVVDYDGFVTLVAAADQHVSW